MDKDNDCVFCGDDVGEYGNNPAPLADEGKCCDTCNGKVVAYRILSSMRYIK